MPGHLFVVRGDLTRFACDAWLLPTSWTLWIESYWLRYAEETLSIPWVSASLRERDLARGRSVRVYRDSVNTPEAWKRGDSRTFPWAEWDTSKGHVRPWLTDMAAYRQRTVHEKAAWFADGACEFVRTAAAHTQGQAANSRHRPLLALPVVGTGAGGGFKDAGIVIGTLVRELLEAVQTVDADVVIVTHSEDQFAAVQHARREIEREGRLDPWASLVPGLRAHGEKLAAHARDGELVLFLGAGVSVGAGLKGWDGLLDELAVMAGLSADEQAALGHLDVLDRASIIQLRLERGASGDPTPGALVHAVATATTAERYGLSHALLASLPVRESVTTNYDTLFELASEAAGWRTAVLPYASAAGARRWLLKMHGCVSNPQHIVLTRQDYMRYDTQRSALAGIVQALLITKQMLFVGFSLADVNFLRIADEVRRVVQLPGGAGATTGREPFGTALLLDASPFMQSLWESDISCVSMPAATTSAAANQLEILLDYVLAEASQNTSHLLDGRYDGLLMDGERKLRDALFTVQEAARDDPSLTDLPAWKPIQALLESLGAKPIHRLGGGQS